MIYVYYIDIQHVYILYIGGRAGPQQDHRQRRPLSPVDQDHPFETRDCD